MQNVWSLLLWKRNVMKTPSSGLLKLLMMYVHTYYIFKNVNISHHRHPDVIWNPDNYIQLIHELRACHNLAWRVYRWDTGITMHMCRMPLLNTIPVSQMYAHLTILMCLYKLVNKALCYLWYPVYCTPFHLSKWDVSTRDMLNSNIQQGEKFYCRCYKNVVMKKLYRNVSVFLLQRQQQGLQSTAMNQEQQDTS